MRLVPQLTLHQEKQTYVASNLLLMSYLRHQGQKNYGDGNSLVELSTGYDLHCHGESLRIPGQLSETLHRHLNTCATERSCWLPLDYRNSLVATLSQDAEE